MVEWWSEISKRAHSSTFTQPGDGSLEAMSRSGSVMRSSSVMGAKSPELAPAALPAGPSPPYVAQAQHDQSHDEKAVHAAAAPVTPPAAPVTPPTTATPAASSPAAQPATLERTDTGSTASLKAVEPAPAAAPAVVPPTQA